MDTNLKKSLFFPGGEVLYASVLKDDQGLQFIRNENGSWTITLKVTVVKDEATGMIQRFPDFPAPPEGVSFEDAYPNQVYVEAFSDDAALVSQFINLDNAKLTLFNSHKSDADGQIILTLTPTDGVGKTKNGGGKTKDAADRVGNGNDPVK